MKSILHLIFILGICTFFSCSSDDDSNEAQALFYWNQTKCADPWNTGENDSNEVTEIAVIAFLESENIIVDKLSFDSNSPLDRFCESCGCGTGERIIVEVNNSDASKMEDLGFYR